MPVYNALLGSPAIVAHTNMLGPVLVYHIAYSKCCMCFLVTYNYISNQKSGQQ